MHIATFKNYKLYGPRIILTVALFLSAIAIPFANASSSTFNKTPVYGANNSYVQFATKTNKSDATELSGKTIPAMSYIFVKSDGVDDVYFYLDTPDVDNKLNKSNMTERETQAPFDLQNSVKQTKALQPGEHLLRVVIIWKDGYTSLKKVPFTVLGSVTPITTTTTTTSTSTTTTSTTTTTTTAPPVVFSSQFQTCYPNPFCYKGKPVTLNGFNMRDIGSDSYMTKFAGLAQFQQIKAKGFNVVRLAMRWEDFQPRAGTNGFDEAKFAKLRTMVDNAKASGVYVILDPIHGTGRGNCSGTDGHIPAWAQVSTNGVCGQRIGAINVNAKDYIQRVARDYKAEVNVVAIDLANEIQSISYTDDVQLLQMYDRLINWVRTVDSEKILIIESQSGERILGATAMINTISNKSNLVYSYHDYNGGVHDINGNVKPGCQLDGYDSKGSSCSNRNSVDASGSGYINPAKDKAVLENHIVRNLNNLSTPGLRLPLYVGEYNAYAGLVNADQWRKDMTVLFKKYNISRTSWLYYNQGYGPDDRGHSATDWTSSTDSRPGAWRPWVDDLL